MPTCSSTRPLSSRSCIASSIAVSSRCRSPAARACSMASREIGSRSSRWSRRHRASRRASNAEATSPGSSAWRAMARASALSCSLRSISSVSTSTETSMLRSHTWWSTTSSGSRAMAVVSDADQLRVGALAEREADAGDRQHPRLGGLGEQQRVGAGQLGGAARRPGPSAPSPPAGAAPRCRAARRARPRSAGTRAASVARPLGPRRGVLVRRPRHRLVAGRDAGQQPLARRDEVAGGEEVVGDLGRRDLGAGGRAQRVADAPVEVLAARSGEAPEHGVAHQGVRRDEPPGAVLAQQAGGDDDVGRVEGDVGVELAGGDQHGQRGQRPGDGRQGEQLGARRRQPIDARPEHGAHGVGQLARAGIAAARDQLGEEERVATGRRAQLARRRPRIGRRGAAARRRRRCRARRRARAPARRRGPGPSAGGRARGADPPTDRAAWRGPAPDHRARGAARARAA